jgi:threonine dehydrogenase-like Zn-dependent dehydrogenase
MKAVIKSSWAHVSMTWHNALDLLSSGKIDVRSLITHIMPTRTDRKGFLVSRTEKSC